jgi:hypothetical protein
MDRLMELRKTNSVEVIISHTNVYTGVWNKIEKESIQHPLSPSDASTKSPDAENP